MVGRKLTTKLVLNKSSSSKSISRARLKQTKESANMKEDNDKILKNLTHLHLQSTFISEIGDISKCANLTVLYLQNNDLTRINNLHQTRNLTHLYLQRNKIVKIENLNQLKKLTKLYLGHNNIAVVEGLEELSELQELHLEKQSLAPGETLHFDPRTVRALGNCLKMLNISGNNLTCISDLAGLREIQSFTAADNHLSDLADCEAAVSSWLYLTTAVMVGNPVCTQPKYRERVMASASWSLVSLDGKTVTDVTRTFLKKFEQKRSQLAAQKTSRDNVLSQDCSDKVPPLGNAERNTSANTPALHMAVSGGRTSAPDTKVSAYCAWQAFSGASNKGVLPFPFQTQSKSLEQRRTSKANQPFTAHLPSL